MKSGVRPMESGKCPMVVRNCLFDRDIVRFFNMPSANGALCTLRLSFYIRQIQAHFYYH